MVQIRPIRAIKRWQVIVDDKEKGVILSMRKKFLYKNGNKEFEFDSFHEAYTYIMNENDSEEVKAVRKAAPKPRAVPRKKVQSKVRKKK